MHSFVGPGQGKRGYDVRQPGLLAAVMASNKKPKVDLTDDERPVLPTPDQGLFEALAASQAELEKVSACLSLPNQASFPPFRSSILDFMASVSTLRSIACVPCPRLLLVANQ